MKTATKQQARDTIKARVNAQLAANDMFFATQQRLDDARTKADAAEAALAAAVADLAQAAGTDICAEITGWTKRHISNAVNAAAVTDDTDDLEVAS